jgi:transglutaminase-like putative cysteine protease
MEFEKYLKEDEVINFSNPKIQKLAKELAEDCKSDEEVAKSCFLYVRDNIKHLGDVKKGINTCEASDVLEHKIGLCYAKSHLLAALLRANNIPTGFCYQRLNCNEYVDGSYCLHGLNAIYLKKYGWYKVDPRGNKEGVDAKFNPPYEKLAFEVGEGEYNIDKIYDTPIKEVVDALNKYETYEGIKDNIPDIKE